MIGCRSSFFCDVMMWLAKLNINKHVIKSKKKFFFLISHEILSSISLFGYIENTFSYSQFKDSWKKSFLPGNVENSVSTVLSLIWTVTNKKIDSYVFEQDKVRITFKKNKGCIYEVSAGKRDQILFFFKNKFICKIDVDLIIWSRTSVIF